MSGSVDEIQLKRFSVMSVVHPDRLHLNSNAALTFEVHRVEHLVFHFAMLYRFGSFEHTISQRRLTMVDVRDNTKIPYIFIHSFTSCHTLP